MMHIPNDDCHRERAMLVQSDELLRVENSLHERVEIFRQQSFDHNVTTEKLRLLSMSVYSVRVSMLSLHERYESEIV